MTKYETLKIWFEKGRSTRVLTNDGLRALVADAVAFAGLPANQTRTNASFDAMFSVVTVETEICFGVDARFSIGKEHSFGDFYGAGKRIVRIDYPDGSRSVEELDATLWMMQTKTDFGWSATGRTPDQAALAVDLYGRMLKAAAFINSILEETGIAKIEIKEPAE